MIKTNVATVLLLISIISLILIYKYIGYYNDYSTIYNMGTALLFILLVSIIGFIMILISDLKDIFTNRNSKPF